MCVIDPHKLVITQLFFNIFSWNFQNRFRIEKPLLWEADFWFRSLKKIGGQIPKFARASEFGRQIFL